MSSDNVIVLEPAIRRFLYNELAGLHEDELGEMALALGVSMKHDNPAFDFAPVLRSCDPAEPSGRAIIKMIAAYKVGDIGPLDLLNFMECELEKLPGGEPLVRLNRAVQGLITDPRLDRDDPDDQRVIRALTMWQRRKLTDQELNAFLEYENEIRVTAAEKFIGRRDPPPAPGTARFVKARREAAIEKGGPSRELPKGKGILTVPKEGDFDKPPDAKPKNDNPFRAPFVGEPRTEPER